MFAALQDPWTAFEPLFAQRALLAVVALALAGGALGPSIVLRELPFFTHAVGAGAYPALVVAVGIGAPLALFAPLGALAFAALLWALTRGRLRSNVDAETALLIAGAFALGAVLATTAFSGRSGVAVAPEALLFGSILTASAGTIALAYLAAAFAGLAVWALGARWLASGFDPIAETSGHRAYDAALLVVVALAVAAALPLAGALMSASLLVVPAATARVLTARSERLYPLAFVFALIEALLGLYLALALDLPPGAVVATLAGTVFVLAALAQFALRAAGGAGRRPAVAIVCLIFAGTALGGCGSNGSSDAEAPVVVATTTQVGDLVRQVGGDDVLVTTLLQPESDPHEYEPKPSDVAALADARVIFTSGGDLDAWLQPAVDASGSDRKPVRLSDAVVLFDDPAEQSPEGEANGDMAFNPHWYLDATNLAAAANRVRDELTKANPASRETYRANAKRYADLIDVSTADLRRCAGTIPRDRRVVLAEHNDFQYLGRLVGLKITAQLRETGASESSARDVDESIALAREDGAAAVVASKGESTQLAKTVARRLDVPLLELYADSLADSGLARTTLGAVAENTRHLVDALGGDPQQCPRLGG